MALMNQTTLCGASWVSEGKHTKYAKILLGGGFRSLPWFHLGAKLFVVEMLHIEPEQNLFPSGGKGIPVPLEPLLIT